MGQPLPREQHLSKHHRAATGASGALRGWKREGTPLMSQPEEVPFPEHGWGSCVPVTTEKPAVECLGPRASHPPRCFHL